MTGAVLVTGAAGFIGAHLCRRLATLGHPVRAVDVRSRPPELGTPGIDYHQVDVRDLPGRRELMRGIEIVFHLASVHLQVHAGEEEFNSVNVGAVEGLVAACAEEAVRRFIHTSSVGIYGHVCSPPAREDSPTAPETPYERTKLAGERAALRRASELGLEIIVLRPAWVYGPGCPRTAKLMRTLKKRRFFYVGRGANLRHPLFIEDMVEAFLQAAQAPAAATGRAYIIAGPRAMALREMIDTFARVLEVRPPRLAIPVFAASALGWGAERLFGLLRKEPPLSRRSLAFFLNDNAFDTGAAARDLGFLPRIDLEEGLRRMLAESSRTGSG